MQSFPRTLPPRLRLILGVAGVLGVVVIWWALTLPFLSEEVVRTKPVPTGRVEVLPHPVTGEPVEVPVMRTERTVEIRRRALVNPPALDTPGNTLRDAWWLMWDAEPSLFDHIGRSTWRILLGFVISSVVAVPLGIAMGLYPHLRALISPSVSFLRPLPSISWVPLAIIWLGAGGLQKLAIVFMGTFAAALIYTVEATLRVDPDLIKAARNLGAGQRQLLRHVLLPAALPNIVSGLKVVLAIGWTCVISAEIVGTQRGLGALIWQSKETANTTAVLVGIVCISGIVLLLALVTTRVERHLLPYLFLREEASPRRGGSS